MRSVSHRPVRLTRRCRPTRRPHACRLLVEKLEDRSVPSGFQQTNLVSDLPGVALIQDPKLVNPWGVSFSPTSPFWVSDNGSAFSTLYQGDSPATPTFSKAALEVSIPSADPGGALPTGQVFNASSDFKVPNGTGSSKAIFIFASQTGEISGWNGGTQAKLAASVPGASYTGLAIGSVGTANYLYAADFGHHDIAVFDGAFQPATLPGGFRDPAMPHSYAPFNIQNIGGRLYVTYAQIDPKSPSDESDRGAGFVDVFDTSGNLLQRLVSGNHLNAPWGVAIAPSNFGAFGGDLLVGNFGNGRIQAFDPTTGEFRGVLKDGAGKPIVIDGLWSLTFGNGKGGGDANKLYFTAGPDDETHGLFGSLAPAPASGPAVATRAHGSHRHAAAHHGAAVSNVLLLTPPPDPTGPAATNQIVPDSRSTPDQPPAPSAGTAIVVGGSGAAIDATVSGGSLATEAPQDPSLTVGLGGTTT